MPYCVSVETMRKSDAWTIENKISSKELMKRAGTAIFKAADWKGAIAVVCGKGNNAGDGFVVADLLAGRGIPVDIYLLSDSFSEDGKYYHGICDERGIKSIFFKEGMSFTVYGSVLDCIFGTGFSGEPRGIYGAAIDAINASGTYVVSADINSGINGDTGLGTKYVKSDLTVSIGTFKPGHFLGKAKEAMKEKVNADIGIEIQGKLRWVEE